MALLIINLMLLVAGTFMETIAALTILTPVLMPVVRSFGIDPVHFGIIMILNLMIGLLTPPVGMVLCPGGSLQGAVRADPQSGCCPTW